MSIAPACSICQSESVMKNSRTRHRKQNYKCRDCGRQCVEGPQWRMIS
ncbi:IS1/IS1595 family N-terminal zinc-binding domain-containing protein [Microcoleus vaginatus]